MTFPQWGPNPGLVRRREGRRDQQEIGERLGLEWSPSVAMRSRREERKKAGEEVEEAVAALAVQVDLAATEVVQVVMELVDLVVKDLVDKNIHH